MAKLQVNIISARDLPNMDFWDLTDAYVTVTMGGTEVMKTKVVDNSLNPVWDAKGSIVWDGKSELVFSVWDSDTFTADDWIGQYVLAKGHIRSGFGGDVPLATGREFRKGLGGKVPTISIRVAAVPPEGRRAGCSIM